MLALITGASSGIGRDIARNLSKRGHDLIITGRDENKLLELKRELENSKNSKNNKNNKNNKTIRIIIADLEKEEEVFQLYEKVKNENIDIFINNAGFGTTGEFWKTDLETEINMLKVNDIAMHILFKLILKNMLDREKLEKKKNEYYILNVASLSGFMPGPKMSAYYATKSYMLNLTRGVYKELKMTNSNSKVNISVLCPGPVYTNFCDRANVSFKTPILTSEYTANYAINKMFAKKLVIVPGFFNKCGHVLGKILPSKLVMAVTYRIQDKKNKLLTES